MPLKNKLALVYGFFESLLFVQFIFGWPSLVYIFKQDGIFSAECGDNLDQWENTTGGLQLIASAENITVVNDTNGQEQDHVARFTTCEAQDNRLSLVGSITFGLLCSFVVSGFILDRYGLRVTRVVGSISMALCMYFWAFTTPATSWILMAGGVCLALGTTFLVVSISSESQMAGRYSSIVAGIYNGAANSSPATTALGIKVLYDAGVPRQYSLAFLATLLLVIFTFGSFKLFPRFNATDALPHVKNGMVASNSQDSGSTFDEDIHANTGTNDGQVKDIKAGYNATDKCESDEAEPSILSALRTSLFLLQMLWQVVLVVRFLFVVNVFNIWLTRTFSGDVEKVSFYTNIFGYMQVINLPISLVVGLIIDALRNPKHDYAGVERASAACPALLLTSVMATVLSCMFLEPVRQAGPEKVMMIFTMLLAVCFQSFLISTVNCYFNLAFPASQFGRLFGLTNGIVGIVAVSMYGLIAWGNRTPDGSAWFEVDLFLVILCALTSIHPINIWYQRYKQRKTYA